MDWSGMEKEINVPWRLIVTIIVVLGLSAAVGIGYWMTMRYTPMQPAASQQTISGKAIYETPTNNLTDENARVIAEAAAVAYFTVDFQKPDEWLARFQDISDPDELKVLENVIRPAIWPDLEKGKVETEAAATNSVLVSSGVDQFHGRRYQIWSVAVKLSAEWPNRTPNPSLVIPIPWPASDIAAVGVFLSEVGGEWKFSMFARSEDVVTLAAERPTKEGQ
jgi:hypothetical protein